MSSSSPFRDIDTAPRDGTLIEVRHGRTQDAPAGEAREDRAGEADAAVEVGSPSNLLSALTNDFGCPVDLSVVANLPKSNSGLAR